MIMVLFITKVCLMRPSFMLIQGLISQEVKLVTDNVPILILRTNLSWKPFPRAGAKTYGLDFGFAWTWDLLIFKTWFSGESQSKNACSLVCCQEMVRDWYFWAFVSFFDLELNLGTALELGISKLNCLNPNEILGFYCIIAHLITDSQK